MRAYYTDEEKKRKIHIIILSAIFVVLFALGLWINLRQGIYVGDNFLYRQSENLYRSGRNTIEVHQVEGALQFVMTMDGAEQSALMTWQEIDSPYGERKVTITFSNGEVIEGILGNNNELVNEKGLPLWWDSEIVIVTDGERILEANLVPTNVLCQIAFGERDQYGSIGLVLFGAFWYIVGAVCFMFPEETHFLFSRWRYNQPELSEAGIWWEKVGSVGVMFLGAVFMLRLLIL